MEDRMYEVFEEFYKGTYLITRRAFSYSGLSQEEMKQECAIVYFENPKICEMFEEGNSKGALSLMMVGIRKSLKDFYNFGMHVDRNSVYEAGITRLEMVHSGTNEVMEVEDEIMSKLELERLRSVYGGEYIDDIIEYYELGADRYCNKYGISNDTARQRISRKIKRIRHKES
ncbi:MAG: hypothetical protein ACRCX2_20450 [Paraclostridium sp.]